MPHTVKLSERDQLLLLDLLEQSYRYKIRKLRKNTSITEFERYYIDAVEKIRDNEIKINHPLRNLPNWIKDNLAHSGEEIWQSQRCQEAIQILNDCVRNTYRPMRPRELFK